MCSRTLTLEANTFEVLQVFGFIQMVKFPSRVFVLNSQ